MNSDVIKMVYEAAGLAGLVILGLIVAIIVVRKDARKDALDCKASHERLTRECFEVIQRNTSAHTSMSEAVKNLCQRL